MAETKITRRRILKLGALAAVGALSASPFLCSDDDITDIDPDIFIDPERASIPIKDLIKKTPGARAPKPNVIIVLTDDMGYGDLSCYGGRAIKTPKIDRMAREGVRFTDFYCSSPLLYISCP